MKVSPSVLEDIHKLIDEECQTEEVLPDDYTVTRLAEEKNIPRDRAMRILKDLADRGYFQVLHGNAPGSRKRITIFRPIEPEKKAKK